MGFFEDLQNETCNMSVPILPLRWWGLGCGVLNLCFFGWGTIIAGIKANKASTITIGILQCIIPVLGWIWSIVWAILIIRNADAYTILA